MRSKFTQILTLLLAFIVQFSFAQEKTITGNVTDQQGMPLPGVNIVVKGTNTGTQTDFDGNYSITASEGQVLVFTYLGMATAERTVDASSTVNLQMVEDTQALEEVVVVGYGTQTKQRLVQSISTVNTEDIEDIPAVSPQELLQGQASGVQMVNSSGILGSAPVIKIRGVASINAGGRPLVVIDGVPLNDEALSSGQGGTALNPLADINPNDIASFSVLKDAAAAAIYGSRGANGVVLIQTKSGRYNQKTKISLDISSSWSEVTDTFDMMNADQYRQFLVDSGQENSIDDLPQGSYDWPENVVRTGFSKDLNFSVSGGSEKTTFYAGFTYKDQEGFIVGNDLTRFSGRINLTHQATDWLKVGANLGVTENRLDRVGADNSTFAPLTSAYLQTPWVEPYDEDGNFVNTGFIANVIAIEALDINNSKTFRTTGNIFGEIKLLEGLTYKMDFGIDRILLEEFQRSFEVNSQGGFASDFVAQQNKHVFTNSLSYDTTFGELHDFSTVVGMTYEQTDIRQTSMDATGFLSDQQINIVSASTPGETLNRTSGNRLVGYFGRFNYAYDNKYIVEGSLRRDGSSRFGANTRYGTFWSVGGAWVLSRENFMQDVDWMDNLKVRGNYGVSGNDRIGDFVSREQYLGGRDDNDASSSLLDGNYNGESGLRLFEPGNPNLQWETSASYDIGFEISLLNSRINLNVDYYRKKTTDMLLRVPIPQTNGGISSIWDNLGDMENKGVDIDLNTVNIQTENFSWTTSLNLGFNKNEVLSLPGASEDSEGRRFVTGSLSQRAIEGHSVNTFYLIRYNGVNPETGDAEWLDKDGNVTTSPTASDRVIVGDANPDFVGGFRNTLKYKNWDLNFFFNFSYGNDIFIDGLRFAENPFSFNKRTKLLNIWQSPGDNAHLPSPSSPTFGAFNQRSTAQLRDGSFARLKNLTLGYSLPSDFLEDSFITGVRFYATANNIWTIKNNDLKGIDPEVSDRGFSNLRQGESFFTPPQSKTYLLGARITF